MKKRPELSSCGLHPGPAQPAAGRQGDWQARAEGVAQATPRPERSQQHRMPVAGAAGHAAFMKYAG